MQWITSAVQAGFSSGGQKALSPQRAGREILSTSVPALSPQRAGRDFRYFYAYKALLTSSIS